MDNQTRRYKAYFEVDVTHTPEVIGMRQYTGVCNGIQAHGFTEEDAAFNAIKAQPNIRIECIGIKENAEEG